MMSGNGPPSWIMALVWWMLITLGGHFTGAQPTVNHLIVDGLHGMNDTGYIRSPNYPFTSSPGSNMTIRLTNKFRYGCIRLLFLDWDLAVHSRLIVYQGKDDDTIDKRILTQYDAKPAILSTGPDLFLVFQANHVTDPDVRYVGFKFKYEFVHVCKWRDKPPETRCPQLYFTRMSLPGHFFCFDRVRIVDCVWQLKGPSEPWEYYLFRVHDLKTYGSPSVNFEVRYGPYSEARKVSFHGNWQGFTTTSDTGLYVRLQWDCGSGKYFQFEATKFFTRPQWNVPCPNITGESDAPFPCTNGRCVSQSLMCNGIDNCGDRSDEIHYCKKPTTPTTRPTTTTAIPDYPVRTKDGVQIILVTQQKDYFRGPVQIFDNKQWLGICDHGWSYPEAKVVCRQFGYQGSQSAHRFRKYEIGNIGGSIRIRCSGSERQLHDCYVVSSAEPCLSLYAGVTCYNTSFGADRIAISGKESFPISVTITLILLGCLAAMAAVLFVGYTRHMKRARRQQQRRQERVGSIRSRSDQNNISASANIFVSIVQRVPPPSYDEAVSYNARSGEVNLGFETDDPPPVYSALPDSNVGGATSSQPASALTLNVSALAARASVLANNSRHSRDTRDAQDHPATESQTSATPAHTRERPPSYIEVMAENQQTRNSSRIVDLPTGESAQSRQRFGGTVCNGLSIGGSTKEGANGGDDGLPAYDADSYGNLSTRSPRVRNPVHSTPLSSQGQSIGGATGVGNGLPGYDSDSYSDGSECSPRLGNPVHNTPLSSQGQSIGGATGVGNGLPGYDSDSYSDGSECSPRLGNPVHSTPLSSQGQPPGRATGGAQGDSFSSFSDSSSDSEVCDSLSELSSDDEEEDPTGGGLPRDVLLAYLPHIRESDLPPDNNTISPLRSNNAMHALPPDNNSISQLRSDPAPAYTLPGIPPYSDPCEVPDRNEREIEPGTNTSSHDIDSTGSISPLLTGIRSLPPGGVKRDISVHGEGIHSHSSSPEAPTVDKSFSPSPPEGAHSRFDIPPPGGIVGGDSNPTGGATGLVLRDGIPLPLEAAEFQVPQLNDINSNSTSSPEGAACDISPSGVDKISGKSTEGDLQMLSPLSSDSDAHREKMRGMIPEMSSPLFDSNGNPLDLSTSLTASSNTLSESSPNDSSFDLSLTPDAFVECADETYV